MARPIALDTTYVRLDANNKIVHMLSYGVDPFLVQQNAPVWVNAIKPDGTTFSIRFAEISFASTFTQIGLYNDGSIAFQKDATPLLNTSGNPIPNSVIKYYAPLGVSTDTPISVADITFNRGVLSQEKTVTGAVTSTILHSADGRINPSTSMIRSAPSRSTAARTV